MSVPPTPPLTSDPLARTNRPYLSLLEQELIAELLELGEFIHCHTLESRTSTPSERAAAGRRVNMIVALKVRFTHIPGVTL